MCVAAIVLGCASPKIDSPAAPSLRALIEAGDLAGADALIAARPDALDHRRALDLAIRSGRLGAVEHFLKRVRPDAALHLDGTTPLLRALLDAPTEMRWTLTATLLQAGADPDRPDRYGRTPLSLAIARGEEDLILLLEGRTRPQGPRTPAFASWLGTGLDAQVPPGSSLTAPRVGARAANGAVASTTARTPAAVGTARAWTPLTAPGALLASSGPTAQGIGGPAAQDAAGRARLGSAARAALSTPAPPAPPAGPLAVPTTASMLLRQSPWHPEATAGRGTGDVAALRFHGDGSADLLRHRPGTGRYDPMPRSYVAWRIEGGGLRLSVVGEAFSALCVGTAVAVPPPPPPRTRAQRALPTPPIDAEALALDCLELPAPVAMRGAGWSLDLARAMLVEDRTPRSPSMLAIATSRAAPNAETVVEALEPAPALAVTLRGAAPGSTCRAASVRPRTLVPPPGAVGDWYALDVRRFEPVSPLSGRFCLQTDARDAAMKACRAGHGGGALCRSVGGCPIGQASALAGLPGVEAGWVGCAVDLDVAREKALSACRAEIGCDCQLITASGGNLGAVVDPAICPLPSSAGRRRSPS
ncbi:MAG: ankyrin repeat domain-containing protein [Burkholderiaceae bacterium]